MLCAKMRKKKQKNMQNKKTTSSLQQTKILIWAAEISRRTLETGAQKKRSPVSQIYKNLYRYTIEEQKPKLQVLSEHQIQFFEHFHKGFVFKPRFWVMVLYKTTPKNKHNKKLITVMWNLSIGSFIIKTS